MKGEGEKQGGRGSVMLQKCSQSNCKCKIATHWSILENYNKENS